MVKLSIIVIVLQIRENQINEMGLTTVETGKNSQTKVKISSFTYADVIYVDPQYAKHHKHVPSPNRRTLRKTQSACTFSSYLFLVPVLIHFFVCLAKPLRKKVIQGLPCYFQEWQL